MILQAEQQFSPLSCYTDTGHSLAVGYLAPAMKDLTSLHALSKRRAMWLGSHDTQLLETLDFQVESAFDVGCQTVSKSGAEAGNGLSAPTCSHSL